VARFFVVAAIALALIGGVYLRRSRALRWAAYVGVAGVLLFVVYGPMAGMLVMLAASVCFWLAARAPVVEEVAQRPSRNLAEPGTRATTR
jgi:uncharacterized membrane protein YedE/YeeE